MQRRGQGDRMNALYPGVLEQDVQATGGSNHLCSMQGAAVKAPEVARISGNQQVCTRMHGCGEDGRIRRWHALAARPFDECGWSLADQHHSLEQPGQAFFEPARLEFEIAPRLFQRVAGSHDRVAFRHRQRDELLGPACFAMCRGKHDVRIEEKLQRLRRPGSFRKRAFSAPVSRLA